jgi:[citrate (pro-3S)-lyase] ligase
MSCENTDYREDILDLHNPFDVKLVSGFLTELGFDFQADSVEYTVMLYNLGGDLIGTGSCKENVLKYVAVSPKFRETTAFAKIITHLINRVLGKYQTVFAFTKPRNIVVFEGLGFRKIATAEPLFSVLEYGISGIQDFVQSLCNKKQEAEHKTVASIVMNANPFTFGHLHLIETAAKACDWLYLFIVRENLSVFPFEVRWELIEKGTAHIPNITLVSGGDYMVSGKTFPYYFLKGICEDERISLQAELDVKIFRDYVVPTLGITHRFIGDEVYCKTTAAYNVAMKKLLPPAGVEVVEIDRKKAVCGEEAEYISASKIRKAIKENTLSKFYTCIPESTINFLVSEEAEEIREKIRASEGRH